MASYFSPYKTPAPLYWIQPYYFLAELKHFRSACIIPLLDDYIILTWATVMVNCGSTCKIFFGSSPGSCSVC